MALCGTSYHISRDKGRKVYLAYTTMEIHCRLKSRQELKQELETETVKECCWWVHSQDYTTQDSMSRHDATNIGLVPPRSISNRNNLPQTHQQANLIWVILLSPLLCNCRLC